MSATSQDATRKGFTIIELLVVIGVIAVLAAMLMPAVGAALNKANETATVNLMHQIEIGLTAYQNDYGDYPPSTWAEYFDGAVPASLTGPPSIADYNEGIEVLVACLATQSGGPYFQAEADQIGNTDGDTDDGAGTVAGLTNWYFGSDELFELVDRWGNPIVYIHNRDYYADDGLSSGTPEDPTSGGTEYLTYVDVDGKEIRCYARSDDGMRTGNYPNISGYQLFSFGRAGMDPDRNSTLHDAPDGSYWYIRPDWHKGGFMLGNWEEARD